jgi:hypothetical protein
MWCLDNRGGTCCRGGLFVAVGAGLAPDLHHPFNFCEMTKEEKKKWIEDYLSDPNNARVIGVGVDILNYDFVLDYIEGVDLPKNKWLFQPYGAHKVFELGAILSEMYKDGVLRRQRTGIQCGYAGMPKWVYVYNL